MNRHTYPVKTIENNITPLTAKFTTNNTSAPDGLTNNLTSVTRTAAGKFTVVFKDNYPACLFPTAQVVGAAGYDAYVTAVSTSANGNVTGCTLEVWGDSLAGGAAATGTLTVDTKANTTTGDYFVLNDGQETFGFELNTTGTSRSHYSKRATGTVTLDTKANTTTGDYFLLNDGQRIYGFELNTTGATALHHITSTAATGTITCDTKANTTNHDYFILYDGQASYAFELDTTGGGGTHSIVGASPTIAADRLIVVDISSGTTAADISALLVTAINGTDIQITAADGTGSVTLTADSYGPAGNTQQSGLGTLHNAWAVTDMAGGYRADVIADTWTVIDVSSGTTAADLSGLVTTAINATDIQITATDATGSVSLQNDNYGTVGNTQQYLSETGTTLLAVTDMTGGALIDVVADHWNVIDISSATTAAQVSALVTTAINATTIQITAADATGSVTLTNDNAGAAGNTQQYLSETGTTLLALTDMTGGTNGARTVADTNNYDVYLLFWMRNSKLTSR